MVAIADDVLIVIGAGILYICSVWAVQSQTEPIKLPELPKSHPKPMATEAVVIDVIEGQRARILAEAAALSACCPPCVPPVGTVCVFVHLYGRKDRNGAETAPHAPCFPPVYCGHFHIKIRKQFIGRSTGECGCTWESIDPHHMPGLCIEAGVNFSAVLEKYLTAGSLQCQDAGNSNHIPIA